MTLQAVSIAQKIHHKDARWVNAQFNKLPPRFRPAVDRRFVAAYESGERGYTKANTLVRDAVEGLGKNNYKVAGDEDSLRSRAMACANQCKVIAYLCMGGDVVRQMCLYAEREGVAPTFPRNVTDAGKLARFTCELWWRRQIRKTVARKVEKTAIGLGLVHKRAGIYASHETVARRQGQKRRNRALLESITAVNDEGGEYTLQALSDLGVSNPKIRRGELMLRLAGFDAIALGNDDAAEFVTMTAPSSFHAIDSASGRMNPKYDQATTPKAAQAYLCKVWARIRAKLARHGVKLYGVRVAEPHHDGTPHWHMVLFFSKAWPGTVRRASIPRVRAIMRRYALEMDKNERGAREHRFTAISIDRSKGTAAGYLAKYISKNIDAHGVGEDYEGGDAANNAKRVDAWAACWGIRQFQQIGGAPVTVWRELRRLETGDGDGLIGELIAAADAANWRRYVELMGGATVERKALPVRLMTEWSDKRTRYDGEGVLKVMGIESATGADFERTRWREWVFLRRGEAAPPWSTVNNCTRGKNGNRDRMVDVSQPCAVVGASGVLDLRDSRNSRPFNEGVKNAGKVEKSDLKGWQNPGGRANGKAGFCTGGIRGNSNFAKSDSA